MMVHQGAKLEFWIGLSTNSFSTPDTGIPEDISSTVNPFCQKNLSGAVDADFKTSLSVGIVGQANPSNKEWLSDVSVLISNCPWYEVSRSA